MHKTEYDVNKKTLKVYKIQKSAWKIKNKMYNIRVKCIVIQKGNEGNGGKW